MLLAQWTHLRRDLRSHIVFHTVETRQLENGVLFTSELVYVTLYKLLVYRYICERRDSWLVRDGGGQLIIRHHDYVRN